MSTDTNKSSRDIEHDIARTRSELNETVDAIQDRLSPDQLVDRAVDYFRDDTVRSRITEAVRSNPLAAVLIGIGVGWLLLGMRNRETEDYDRLAPAGETMDEPYRSARAAARYREADRTLGDEPAGRAAIYRESTDAPPTSVPDLAAAGVPLSGAAVAAAETTRNPPSPNLGTTNRVGSGTGPDADSVTATPGGTATAGVAGAAGTTPASAATTLTSREETRARAAGAGTATDISGPSPTDRSEQDLRPPSVSTASTSGSSIESGGGDAGKRGERKTTP